MEKFISIKDAAQLFGVVVKTLRRWEFQNKLIPHHRTLGGHRRYKLNDILRLIKPMEINDIEINKTICYARVSSKDQSNDLTRQLDVLKLYVKNNNIQNVEYINDVGSGLNFKKSGLNKLINLILNKKINKIILTHKDRLLRFGSELIINIAKQFGIQTIIINSITQSFEQELCSDVLEIITVFSAKLYGSRSHKNKKILNMTLTS